MQAFGMRSFFVNMVNLSTVYPTLKLHKATQSRFTVYRHPILKIPFISHLSR